MKTVYFHRFKAYENVMEKLGLLKKDKDEQEGDEVEVHAKGELVVGEESDKQVRVKVELGAEQREESHEEQRVKLEESCGEKQDRHEEPIAAAGENGQFCVNDDLLCLRLFVC